MIRSILRVASIHTVKSILAEGAPNFPSFLLKKQALAYDEPLTQDAERFLLAKDSVNVFLPKFRDMLRAAMKETYYMSISNRGTDAYWYFQAKVPLDVFWVQLRTKNSKTWVTVGYAPFHLTQDRPDYSKAVERTIQVDEEDLSGLVFMRLAREVLKKALI